MLAAWISPVLAQEYVAIVCASDTGMAYYVQGTEGSTFEWTVDGGSISRNFGDSIIVDWGDVSGEYELTVQEISEFGCNSEPKTATVLVSAPDINLGDDTYICSGEIFALSPIGDFYSYEWNDGSILPNFTTGEDGFITCKVSDKYGCFREDQLYLEVKVLPVVELGNDTSLCGDQYLYLDGGYDAINFEWSTDEISQEIVVYQGYKMISVLVEDEFGCVNYDTIVIDDCDPGIFFKDIPTAITPNGDGTNDVWRLEKLEAYPESVIDIFDRWGKLVFRSEPGYPEPWDGRNMRGDLVPMDSYHFVILLNFGNDDRIIGSVTVIR